MPHDPARRQIRLPLSMIGALMLAALLGFLVGRIVAVRRVLRPLPVQMVEDTRPGTAVVIIEGIRDGKVVGSLRGDVRLWMGDKEVFPDAEGKIAADPGPLLVNDVSVPVPEGMQFVASRRGSKYHPVLSAGGQSIVPKNRIYFETAEEAERAGYHR